VPKSRFHWSPLYDTKEWKDVLKELDRGLKPMEALEVSLSEETVASLALKDPFQALFVALKRWVRAKKLPIDVRVRNPLGETEPKIFLEGRSGRIA